ncbi:zinc finger protein 423-like [Manduca sexta]|nr:zinc finger protein 423-like [Manduca sexta]
MASTHKMATKELVDLNQLYTLPKPTTIDLIGGIYCHICETTFNTKKEYDSHYSQHETGTQDIVYTCVVCRKQFAGYPSFRGHCYIKHVNRDRFKCEYCFKLCSKLSALKQHVAAMHTFICSSCNQK